MKILLMTFLLATIASLPALRDYRAARNSAQPPS
jgi:hypothetical protein